MKIDINFDFQTEVGKDSKGRQRDSDKYSPTLQEYHRILWSKPLPSGKIFSLKKASNNRLYHKSELSEFYLSSDRAVATFSSWSKAAGVINLIQPELLNDFNKKVDTIGGIVIWPSNQINGLHTINAARGCNSKIADRLDLTIECIRRYYLGETSPLFETLKRYDSFFALFEDFRGYIDFFLLQDYVSDDYSTVKISSPFDNFRSSPIPNSVEEYYEYMEYTKALVVARNGRISAIYI